MLAAIDLTARQAARVLREALQTRAQMEIEPRSRDVTLVGNLTARDGELLWLDLHDRGEDWPLAGLVGAFCDVRTVLSGQLYTFCTCILDSNDNTAPQRIALAAPDLIQVINRRRFDRKPVRQPLAVEVWTGQANAPLVGTLRDIGMAGLSCRLPRREAEQQLLIDDQVQIRFRLESSAEPFSLSSTVTVKTPDADEQHLIVGLEFCVPPAGSPEEPVFRRLRTLLAQQYMGPTEAENKP